MDLAVRLRRGEMSDPVLAAALIERSAHETLEDVQIGRIATYAGFVSGAAPAAKEIKLDDKPISTTAGVWALKRFGIEKAQKLALAVAEKLAEADPDLERTDPIFEAAAILQLARKFGQDPRVLSMVSGYQESFIRQVKKGARNCGIFKRGGKFAFAHVDSAGWDADAMLLFLDALAALGRRERFGRNRPRNNGVY